MSRRLGAALGWSALALVVVLAVLAVWAAGRDSAVGDHERSPDDPATTVVPTVALPPIVAPVPTLSVVSAEMYVPAVT